MSVVTNVLLTGIGCERVADLLNLWLNDPAHERTYKSLLRIDGGAGGTRNMETDVFAAGLNWLEVPEFIDEYRRVIAQETRKCRSGLGHVQLFICRQDDMKFNEIPQTEDNIDYNYRTAELDVPRVAAKAA